MFVSLDNFCEIWWKASKNIEGQILIPRYFFLQANLCIKPNNKSLIGDHHYFFGIEFIITKFFNCILFLIDVISFGYNISILAILVMSEYSNDN